MKTIEMSRFDTRIPADQKTLFEYAATLAGFRTLTEFVISAAQSQADMIIEKHNTILASKKDQEIFFNAMLHPVKPNEKLKTAANRYKALTKK